MKQYTLVQNSNKFKPEMHLSQPGFIQSACGPFTKNKEKIQKFKEIQDIFIKTNQIKPAFNIIQVMGILTIYQEHQLLKNYYVIKHLILLKIKDMININMELLQWCIPFFYKLFYYILLIFVVNMLGLFVCSFITITNAF